MRHYLFKSIIIGATLLMGASIAQAEIVEIIPLEYTSNTAAVTNGFADQGGAQLIDGIVSSNYLETGGPSNQTGYDWVGYPANSSLVIDFILDDSYFINTVNITMAEHRSNNVWAPDFELSYFDGSSWLTLDTYINPHSSPLTSNSVFSVSMDANVVASQFRLTSLPQPYFIVLGEVDFFGEMNANIGTSGGISDVSVHFGAGLSIVLVGLGLRRKAKK